jgi:hypothetical protein
MSCGTHGEAGNAGYQQRETSVINDDEQRGIMLSVGNVFLKTAATLPTASLATQSKKHRDDPVDERSGSSTLRP